MMHAVQADVKGLLLLIYHRLSNAYKVKQQLRQGRIAVVQQHLSALYFRHIQDVVD